MTEFPTQEQFRQWLMAKPPTEQIARYWTCVDCPLAKWIADLTGTRPVIRNDRWWGDIPSYGSGGNSRPLPNWARELVYWVDKVRPREITAEECLFIMSIPGFKPERWSEA